jgi:hypothetical protein
MNGSVTNGQNGQRAPAVQPPDVDAERHVARLTGMSLEAARAFVAFHSGRIAARRPD